MEWVIAAVVAATTYAICAIVRAAPTDRPATFLPMDGVRVELDDLHQRVVRLEQNDALRSAAPSVHDEVRTVYVANTADADPRP